MNPPLPPGFVEDDAPALPPGFVEDNAVPAKNPFAETGPTIGNAAKLKAASMGPFRRTLYGAERAFDEAAMGLKQLAVGLTPEETTDLKIRRQTEKEIPNSGYARFAGDVAMALPVARAAQAVTSLPRVAASLGRAAPYAAAVGAGAAGGVIQPTVGEESRLFNTGMGAAGGIAGQAGGDLIGRMVGGLVRTNPNIAGMPQAIRDRMSLGQVADRDTFSGLLASTTEEKLQSLPVVGDWIRGRRQGAVDAWRNDLVNRVSPAGHTPIGDNTWERLADANRAYTSRYVAALRGQQVPPSRLFESQVAQITNNPRSGLSDRQQGEARDLVMRYYNSMFHGNSPNTGPAGTSPIIQGTQRGTPISIDAENAKGFEAFLTKQAAQYRKSDQPGASDMAQLFENLERAWSVSYRRALPSQSRIAIRGLDQSYAPYKTVERAAAYTGNDFGDFTPQQLVQAVRARTPQPRFSRGQGILQNEAASARDTLIDRVPNSGTADRTALASVATGALLSPMKTAATLGIAIPAMTTRTGRNIATGDTRLQEILRQLRMPGVGTASGMGLGDIMNPESSEQ